MVCNADRGTSIVQRCCMNKYIQWYPYLLAQRDANGGRQSHETDRQTDELIA